MQNPNAARREHWLKVKFDEKVTALRDKRSFAANWLEDFRDSFTNIFGLEPAKAWELPAFVTGIYLMLETIDQMEKEQLLPTVGKQAYEQASREWKGPDARALIQREMNFAMNTSLRGTVEFFNMTLNGLPLENEGGRAHCYNELAKLSRMRRLSRM